MSAKCKAKKKSKGRTAPKKRHSQKEETFSQTFVAQLFQCDTRTVARYCQSGLPYKLGPQGKEHQFDLGIAIHWYIGHGWAEKRKLDLSPLEKIIWAHGGAETEFEEHPSFARWRSKMMKSTSRFDCTEADVAFAIGRLSGGGLLKFRHQQW